MNDAVELAADRPLGFLDVEINLKPEEKALGHPEIARQPQIDIRIDRPDFRKQGVYGFQRDAGPIGHFNRWNLCGLR